MGAVLALQVFQVHPFRGNRDAGVHAGDLAVADDDIAASVTPHYASFSQRPTLTVQWSALRQQHSDFVIIALYRMFFRHLAPPYFPCNRYNITEDLFYVGERQHRFYISNLGF